MSDPTVLGFMTRSTVGAGRRVLYVDPDDERARPVLDALRDAGYTAERASGAVAAVEVLGGVGTAQDEHDGLVGR